jgi:hypothetical protein
MVHGLGLFRVQPLMPLDDVVHRASALHRPALREGYKRPQSL